ncbi:MAG: 5'-methylthioadenosine/adenosylhomocysteine nucleosidase [Bacteroidetes bacterium]|nr:5'-methylthioadenosine/adenosylhomocysteine nucleosidase [Bacteroidota bacterium]
MKSLSFLFLFLLLSLDTTAQRTAILGALDQEIAILLDSLKEKKEVQRGGLTFYTGKLNGQEVVIGKSGVGKVNAAYSTAILLDHFTPKQLIFTGVAGGLHPEALPGDVVIGTKLIQTDFGQIDSLGFQISPFRKLSGGRYEDLYIHSDPELVQQAEAAAKQVTFLSISTRAPRVFSGVIATADVFVSNQETAEKLFADYQALATEMEGAAVAHLCRTLGVPFVVLRSCSDNANKTARVSFNQFVRLAAINSAGIVLQLLYTMN